MSIRNLDFLLTPSSVAVLGASTRPDSVGATVWCKLHGSGFKGPVYAVNPKHDTLDGEKVYANVQALPTVPDLALICTPAATVPGLIAQLGALGTRAAVVFTPGLDAAQKQAMRDAARPYLLRLLGPDSIGLLAPHLGLNASTTPGRALPGELAFVTPSGGLMSAMLDWAQSHGIGFSYLVCLGEQADVDGGDLLDYLASDSATRAILLHIETITASRKFMSAARAAARNKPVIVLKSGRSGQNEDSDADRVVDAAIARAGMLRVDTLEQLFLVAQSLASFRTSACDQLTILSNSRGVGMLAADAAAPSGVALVGDTQYFHSDAPVQRYVQALQTLLNGASNRAVLLVHAPSSTVPSSDIARALLPLVQSRPARLLSCWLGGTVAIQARQIFQKAGIASFATPEQAMRAFALGVSYRSNQAQLLQTPWTVLPGPAPDKASVQALVQQVLAGGRELLSEPEALAVLRAYRIAVRAAPSWTESPDDAARRAKLPKSAEILLRVGTRIDPVFGPVMRLGQGGSGVPGLGEHAMALPPLNGPLARALVERTRVHHLLSHLSNGTPPDAQVNLDALDTVLMAVSQLLADIPQLAELDINPLSVNFEGVTAIHVNIRLSADAPAGERNFAIRPYPAELIETLQWQGQMLTLRPIRSEDEAQHRAFLTRLDPEDIRMRVFYSRRSIEHTELARLVQIDYEREMVFIAVACEPDDASGTEQTLGVVRAVADPDNRDAEFGIIIRSDLKGQGLGSLMMNKLIRYQRARGTQRLVGTVIAENRGMRALAKRLGFVEGKAIEDDALRNIYLDLQSLLPT